MPNKIGKILNFWKIIILLILLIPIIIGLFFIFSSNSKTKIKLSEANLISEELSPGDSDIDNLDKDNDDNDDNDDNGIAPEVVKAIYLTSWSVSRESRIKYAINLAKTTELNALVIDIKDFSGYVAYDTALPEVIKYNAEQIRISDIDSLIQRLHQEGIYVIARISVFQDPVLARARPDLAIHSKSKLASNQILSSSSLWLDNMRLAWIDPAAKEAWDYNIAIAKDALKRGFDELNFDYVRFPSDGNLQDMNFTFWDRLTPRHLIIKDFFGRLRQQLPDAKLSIDLFGLSTVSFNDLGVGQLIEDAYQYFDYVCPMIYPSHYDNGFLGYQNPAQYPYEVVRYSMENALRRLRIYNRQQEADVSDNNETKREERKAQLRPWLQDFDLGAIYDAEMVRAEIKAVYDAAGDGFKGFMLWNSSNFYTKGALQK